MDDISLDDPSSIEKYLKSNLSEGYLADDEEEFVDDLVSKLEKDESIQEAVKEINLNEVSL